MADCRLNICFAACNHAGNSYDNQYAGANIWLTLGLFSAVWSGNNRVLDDFY